MGINYYELFNNYLQLTGLALLALQTIYLFREYFFDKQEREKRVKKKINLAKNGICILYDFLQILD